MTASPFEISGIAGLLRLPITDKQVADVFGPLLSKVERDAYYGFIELRDHGLDVVFNEAPWVVPESEIVDPKLLYLCAFHFHREAHEGYSGYAGKLPNGIALGDTEADVLSKMGKPFASGGGGMSSVPPKLPIPRWLKYHIDDAILHLRLDDDNRLEMATLMAPDVRPKAKQGV